MIYNTRNQSKDTAENQKEKKDLFKCSCRRKVKLEYRMFANKFERCILLEYKVIKKLGYVKV